MKTSHIYPYTIWANVQHSIHTSQAGLIGGSAIDLITRIGAAIHVIRDVIIDFLKHERPKGLSSGDVLAICLPEFFFRGGAEGYYLPETIIQTLNPSYYLHQFKLLPEHAQTRYNVRKYAAELLLQFLTNYTYSIAIELHHGEPYTMAICFGTIPIGSGRISNKYQISNPLFSMQKLTKVDNFALVSGGQCPIESVQWTGMVTPKRTVSPIDYFFDPEAIEKSGSVFIPHPTGLSRMRALATPHRSITTVLGHNIKIQAGRTPRPHRIAGGNPSDLLSLYIHRQPQYRPIIVTSSICLDYMELIGSQEIAAGEFIPRSADILFVPAAGEGLLSESLTPNVHVSAYYHTLKLDGVAIGADGNCLESAVAVMNAGIPILQESGIITPTPVNSPIKICDNLISREDADSIFREMLFGMRWNKVNVPN